MGLINSFYIVSRLTFNDIKSYAEASIGFIESLNNIDLLYYYIGEDVHIYNLYGSVIVVSINYGLRDHYFIETTSGHGRVNNWLLVN